MEPHGSADPRGSRHLHCPPRPGIQLLRACSPRDWDQPRPIRSDDRLDQDFASRTPKLDESPEATLRDVLCRMGPRSVADSLSALRNDGNRSWLWRHVRHQCLGSGLWVAGRIRRSWRASDRLDGRPAGVHRAQRIGLAPGGSGPRWAPLKQRWSGHGSVQCAADHRGLAAEWSDRGRLLSR